MNSGDRPWLLLSCGYIYPCKISYSNIFEAFLEMALYSFYLYM